MNKLYKYVNSIYLGIDIENGTDEAIKCNFKKMISVERGKTNDLLDHMSKYQSKEDIFTILLKATDFDILNYLDAIDKHKNKSHTIIVKNCKLISESLKRNICSHLQKINAKYELILEDDLINGVDDILIAWTNESNDTIASTNIPNFGKINITNTVEWNINFNKYYITGYEYPGCHIISHWSGRLGNTFVQIINAIYSAQLSNTPVIFPPHSFLNANLIIPNANIKRGKEHLWGHFFYNKVVIPNLERRQMTQTFICPLMKHYDYRKVWDEKYVVIHIRSGDMIEMGGIAKDNNGGDFTQPNEHYYDQILSQNKFEHVLVVTEPDMKNPMIEYLRSKYSAIVQSLSLEEDFYTLLNAVNVIASNSTFSLQPLYMSNVLKNFWHPCFMLKNVMPLVGDITGIKIHSVSMI